MDQEAHEENATRGLVAEVRNELGVLHQLTGIIARAGGNITWVAILDSRKPIETVFFEIGGVDDLDPIIEQLKELPEVARVAEQHTLKRVFGKRLIIIGGGAQVGQVAVGAVAEADRHNLRGERISVDTIPLVGEAQVAEAVRAVARLPRARALVLAGALMGGEIEDAVREVRDKGLIVICLNMAGSVPDASDLVVSDPIQAGVMAVMAIADTASFDVHRLTRKAF
ncbi:MAG: ACT domain-containing protein [Acidobacteriia bacterium]|nr:ACT domain-containing protein [Terriglobia bacterium]